MELRTDINQRGWGKGMMEKKGKGHEGTCIKDLWTNRRAGREGLRVGSEGSVGQGRAVWGKWRQLYLNNN